MARTNLITHPSVSTPKTHEGAPAKRIDAEAQLRRSVMACLLWEDQFYEDGESIAERIAGLVAEVAPEKVLTLAAEAREQMYLRHAPLWLIVAALKAGHRKGVAETLAHVIQRADELAEFVALYWKDGKAPLAAQVKRGLAAAFPKFDAYQLAKYNRDGAVKLRDVLFLCHATPKDAEQAATWKQLVDDTLPAPDTWEVALSTGKDKAATWARLIAEGNLGGLAILRNLRNMQEAGVPDATIRKALTDGNFKRVLPFRFVAAARYAPLFEPELEAAMLRASADLPKLTGKTILLLDVSGSMDERLSAKSDLTRMDAGAALAVLLREVCPEVEIITFSNQGVIVPARRGFALRDAVIQSQPHQGTYTQKAKELADTRGYDRLIIVTDEQSHEALTNPKGRGYVVNVASFKNGIGYGAWTHIDGWSENVVRYIAEAERGQAR